MNLERGHLKGYCGEQNKKRKQITGENVRRKITMFSNMKIEAETIRD